MKRKVTVRGTGKNDVLDSLKDGDIVAGGKGSDTYEYKLGDGDIRIREPNDKKSTDTLVLSDLDADDVSFFRHGNTLKILVHETGDVIVVAGQFNGTRGVEQIAFADGVTIDASGIADMAAENAGIRINQAKGIMRGDGGDNVLVAHEGFSTLAGRKGSDTYVVDADIGDIVIRGEGGKSADDTDTLQLSGLSSSDVTLTRDGRDLVITIDETGGTITVRNHFAGKDASRGLEVIELSDITLDEAGIADVADNGWPEAEVPGVEVEVESAAPPAVYGTDDAEDLHGTDAGEYVFGLAGDDNVYGEGGDDIIDAGAGLDTIWGGEGADSFVYAAGSGNDYIIDFNPGEDKVLIGSSLLGDGKDPMDYAYQDGASVIFEFDGQILVLWGQDIANIDETMFEVFNDQGGTEGRLIEGTDGDDVLFGSYGDDLIFGGAGFDEIRGSHGADTFVFNAGSDRDFIIDFNADHDRINIDPTLIEAGKTVWDYAYEDGGSTIFEFATGDSIVLWHVGLDDLNPGIFDTMLA